MSEHDIFYNVLIHQVIASRVSSPSWLKITHKIAVLKNNKHKKIGLK